MRWDVLHFLVGRKREGKEKEKRRKREGKEIL